MRRLNVSEETRRRLLERLEIPEGIDGLIQTLDDENEDA